MTFPNRYRVSTSATEKLRYLKSKTGLTPNILCRFAITAALRDIKGLAGASSSDLNGQEFNSSTLFGEHIDIYEVFIRQFIIEQQIAEDPTRCVAMLIDLGLHKLGHIKNLKDLLNYSWQYLPTPELAHVWDDRGSSK